MKLSLEIDNCLLLHPFGKALMWDHTKYPSTQAKAELVKQPFKQHMRDKSCYFCGLRLKGLLVKYVSTYNKTQVENINKKCSLDGTKIKKCHLKLISLF